VKLKNNPLRNKVQSQEGKAGGKGLGQQEVSQGGSIKEVLKGGKDSACAQLNKTSYVRKCLEKRGRQNTRSKPSNYLGGKKKMREN